MYVIWSVQQYKVNVTEDFNTCLYLLFVLFERFFNRYYEVLYIVLSMKK